jgi:hypothetical protein
MFFMEICYGTFHDIKMDTTETGYEELHILEF